METISAKATRCKFCCIPIEPPIKMRYVSRHLLCARLLVSCIATHFLARPAEVFSAFLRQKQCWQSILACVSMSPLMLIVYNTYYNASSKTQTRNAQVLLYISQPQALVPVASSPSCMRLCSWSSCRYAGCRKVKAFMDDAEVIIPLKGYNPETRTKISSHVTTTARSTAGQTPRYQGGTAPHHMQGPCIFTADATGHDTQSSMV